MLPDKKLIFQAFCTNKLIFKVSISVHFHFMVPSENLTVEIFILIRIDRFNWSIFAALIQHVLSAIIFTNVSKVELGKILNFFETHDIISTIWVDNRVLWVWPNIGPFRP